MRRCMRIVVDIQQDQLPLDSLATSAERHDRGLRKGVVGDDRRISAVYLKGGRMREECGCNSGISGVEWCCCYGCGCAQVGRVVLSLEPGGLDGVDVTKLLVTCRAGCGATEPESLKLDCRDLERSIRYFYTFLRVFSSTCVRIVTKLPYGSIRILPGPDTG